MKEGKTLRMTNPPSFRLTQLIPKSPKFAFPSGLPLNSEKSRRIASSLWQAITGAEDGPARFLHLPRN